jgi:hypothetical protein
VDFRSSPWCGLAGVSGLDIYVCVITYHKDFDKFQDNIGVDAPQGVIKFFSQDLTFFEKDSFVKEQKYGDRGQ